MKFQIFDGETHVLDVSSDPGAIRSTASSPGSTSSTFMSATSHDASHEDGFHRMLVASHSFEEFLALVRAAGLTLNSIA